jgi:drug/metabolite transporter (DMT)-like permease
MVVYMLGLLAVQHRSKMIKRIAEVGVEGVLASAFMACAFFLYILSITRTTAANTFVLMSVSPFFMALLGRIFLGERVNLRTWGAIAVALVGIVIMFHAGIDAGQSFGNILALGIPTALAFNVVVLRRAGTAVNMVPAVLLAAILATIVSLPPAWPLTPTVRDLVVLWIMGWLQLGTGCVLMTMAARHLPAREIGLLALLETTLGPIWVWVGIGERPSDLALIGGMIVVAALLVNGWISHSDQSHSI